MLTVKNILRTLILLLAILIAILTFMKKPASGPSPFGFFKPKIDYGLVENFSFVNQDGQSFGFSDLKGSIWVADFIFTRCAGPCPLLSTRMAGLQSDFGSNPLLRLVSFSVDPVYDTAHVLAEYAKTYTNNTKQWQFLTGPRETIYNLIRTSFHLAVGDSFEEDPNHILHSLNFVLVDKKGHVRGYYNSTDQNDMDQLHRDLRSLLKEPPSRLPALNAGLNAFCTTLLLIGFIAIKKGRIFLHRMLMSGAFVVSLIFLVSYLYYHFHFGSMPFLGTGWIRPVYFFILITHTTLAVAIVPLILVTLFWAIQNRFDKHKKLARWTWPLWLYVSITGLLVYGLLYSI